MYISVFTVDHHLISWPSVISVISLRLCASRPGLGSLLQVPIGGSDYKSTSDLAKKDNAECLTHVKRCQEMSRESNQLPLLRTLTRWQCQSWCWSFLVPILEYLRIHSGHRIQICSKLREPGTTTSTTSCYKLLQAALAFRRVSLGFHHGIQMWLSSVTICHPRYALLYNQYCYMTEAAQKGFRKTTNKSNKSRLHGKAKWSGPFTVHAQPVEMKYIE